MNKIFIYLFMFFIVINVAYSAIPDGCTFVANHYECNLTTQTSSIIFDAGDYGIEVTGINLIGSDGVSGSDGKDVDVTLTSSDKIIINGVTSIVSGSGSTSVCGTDPIYLQGSDGGDGSLVLNAPEVIINNSITLLSGNGASGTGTCSHKGGENGESLLEITSTNHVDIDKSIISITTGTIGQGGGSPEETQLKIRGGGTLLINMSKITLIGGSRVNTSESSGVTVRLDIDIIKDGNIYDTNFSLTPSIGISGGSIISDIEHSNLINVNYLMTGAKGTDATADSYIAHTFEHLNITNSTIHAIGAIGGTPSSYVFSSFNSIYLKNSTYISSAGQGVNIYGIGGQSFVLYGNNIFEDSVINLSVTGTTNFDIYDYSNTFYNKTIFNFIGTGSTVNYSAEGTKTEFRESTFNCTSVSSVCKFMFNSTEINFYNKTTIDLNSATNTLKIYADRALFWDFIEDQSAAQDSDFYVRRVSNSTIGLRGSNTFGAWTWNQNTINQSFDRYFLKPVTLGIVKKTDVGTILYNSTNFTCTYKINRSNENESGMYINISLLKDGAYIYNQTNIAYDSNVNYNSTIQVNGTNTQMGENWSCSYDFYNDGFSYLNVSNNKTISYAYPYNLKIYIRNDLLYNYSGEFSTSVVVDLGYGYINDYVQKYCSTTICTIPLTFTSEINSQINLSHLNISYGVSIPITNANNTIDVPFTVYSDAAGIVNITDLEFTYFGKNANITIIATSKSGLSTNVTLETIFSNYTIDIIPHGIDVWDIGPNLVTPTDKNVPPFGNYNGDGNPFWNITVIDAPKPMDVYIMYNESIDSCIDIWFENLNNNEEVILNDSAQQLFSNYNITDYVNVSTWANLTCSWDDDIVYPYFRFIGICSSCVLTQDWENMNTVIE